MTHLQALQISMKFLLQTALTVKILELKILQIRITKTKFVFVYFLFLFFFVAKSVCETLLEENFEFSIKRWILQLIQQFHSLPS